MDRPRPTVVTPGESNLPAAAPSDAIVLFDGKNLDAWRDNAGNACRWIINADGFMESVPDSGYVFTQQSFGDCQLHVEWASPSKPEGKSQGRGNSGVFLMGLYEVQVLDSFDNDTYPDGQAASIYGQYPPLLNVSRGPGQWQSYDIVFHQDRYDVNGKLVKPATITLFHNGVLVQDHVEVFGPTLWLQLKPSTPHPTKLPLSFQDHGNPVLYRNVWIREIPDKPFAPPTTSYDPLVIQLNGEEIDALAGTYGDFEFIRNDRQLAFKFNDRMFELIPHSKTEFGIRYTAGKIVFETDETGMGTKASFHMGGSVMRHARN